ncbi:MULTISPECIES: hypothetical protein [unclassified Microcoleus]
MAIALLEKRDLARVRFGMGDGRDRTFGRKRRTLGLGMTTALTFYEFFT